MIVLDNVTVGDSFPNENAQQPAAIMFPAVKSNGGYFTITNNPVYVQLAYNIGAAGYGYGQSRWTKSIPFPVGPGILLPGTVGIRFSNYTPGKAAIVSGALAEEAEPSIEVTSSGTAGSTGSGGVKDLAYVETATNVSTSVLAPGIPVGLSTGSIAFDGITQYDVELFCPNLISVIAGWISECLLMIDGVNVGQMCGTGISAGNNIQSAVLARRRLPIGALPAGNHTISINVCVNNAAGQANFFCGPGGAGNFMPAYLRVIPVQT